MKVLRPKELTKEQIEDIADEVVSGLSIDISSKYIVDIINDMFMYSDGYEIAKELESNGFNMSSDLVDELDTIIYLVDEQKRANEKLWIKENNIKPKYKENDKVEYAIKFHDDVLRLRNINGIDFEKGYYKVEIEKGNRQYSTLVKFEDLEK